MRTFLNRLLRRRRKAMTDLQVGQFFALTGAYANWIVDGDMGWMIFCGGKITGPGRYVRGHDGVSRWCYPATFDVEGTLQDQPYPPNVVIREDAIRACSFGDFKQLLPDLETHAVTTWQQRQEKAKNRVTDLLPAISKAHSR